MSRAERDRRFYAWLDTVPLFVVTTIVELWDGVPVTPDAVRLSMPYAEALRDALTA